MTIQFKHSAGLIAMLLLLAACKKNKFDTGIDNRPVTDNRKKSNVRLINLADNNQVIANGDTLTNFVYKAPVELQTYPGTPYFPTNGRLGRIWEIPQDIFDAKEKADLVVANKLGPSAMLKTEFSVENNYSKPTDYILLPTNSFTGQQAVVPVTRDVAAPSKPDFFKIRIINLTGKITYPVTTDFGAQEELQGPVTLTFADGTPVNAKTSQIGSAAVSEYVEVPYGTYQFKVLTDNGRPFPGAKTAYQISSHALIEPVNSNVPVKYGSFSNLVYAPIGVYQPGGIYTVIVTPQQFSYITNNVDATSITWQNSFQVISDNNIAANITYCRMQGVNAGSNQPVTIKVNGKDIATGLVFGKAGEYANLVNGNYTIEATDASGKVIATAEQEVRAGQNYTAWLYAATDGALKLVIVANDLSGVTYNGTSEDGTYDRTQSDYYFNIRFLNLSPEDPYITFTKDNGQLFTIDSASLNLRPGIPVREKPYIRTNYDNATFGIMAYRSSPIVVPGAWADDIPVRSSQDLIARKELYTNTGRPLPAQEPGVYTIAVIGHSGNATPKATMMILKHTK